MRRNSSRSSVSSGGSAPSAPRSLRCSRALGDRHQHRVQDGDGEQAVGEHRQQQMQAELERGRVGAADAAGKQQRQRQRQRGERERRRLQRVQVVDEALQPVEQHREPEHRRERVGEAEAQLLVREQLGMEQYAVQRRAAPASLPAPRAAGRPAWNAPRAPRVSSRSATRARRRGRSRRRELQCRARDPVYHPMLDNLTSRLAKIVKTIRGEARLTEANVQDALREVRIALLEADVALPVVKHFIDAVRAQALGQEVIGSLTPGQALVGVVHRELTRADGRGERGARSRRRAARGDPDGRPAGLGQDHHRRQARAAAARQQKKKVLVVSCDVYRPAAIEQLKTVAAQAGVDFFASRCGRETGGDRARRRRARAHPLLRRASSSTPPGRLAIDEPMMQEIAALHAALQARRDPVRGRRDAGPGRGQRGARVQRARCRSPASC